VGDLRTPLDKIEGTLVAAAMVVDVVDGVEVVVSHTAFAMHPGEPTIEGRSWGWCPCGWTTEGSAPADLTWPACRRHVLDVKSAEAARERGRG